MSWQMGLDTFPVFVCLLAASLLVVPPRYAVSPLSVFYAYYALWFVLAPMFAGKYAGVLGLPEYQAAFSLAYLIFGLGVSGILLGEHIAYSGFFIKTDNAAPPRKATILSLILVLFGLSSLFVYLIVQFSGGLAHWMDNPGQAFLSRAGTGHFVIASHFCSLTLAATVGYAAKHHRTWWPLSLFVLWVLLTSPVHGSKLQIAILLLLPFIPWLVEARFYSLKTVGLGIVSIGVFLAGMYFRDQGVLSSWSLIVSTLNYFTALENLAISVRDFEPSWFQTWFMPFNKIGIAIGLVDQSAYYDMNHMLTDKYYPERWAMRATEQWPVETDLYLNFSFFFGLPIMVAFFTFHGWIYGYARQANSVGAWFLALMLSINLITHLRGSLYNHTDFFMLPYYIAIFYLFRGWTWAGAPHLKKGSLKM